MNTELFIDADRISYKTEYLFTVIDLRDVDSVSLKKSILGEKLVLIGSFSMEAFLLISRILESKSGKS